jgi:hypothetical protein
MGDQGNACCMCLEGLCCPALGMSITRIYVMERKELRPDPIDYQIIAFSASSFALLGLIHLLI